MCEAWHQQQNGLMQGEWERMRLLATITIQPHAKKKLTPQALLPLPWDAKKRKTEKQDTGPKLTKEQQLARFEKLVNKIGK